MKIQFHRIDTNVVVGLLVREFCCSGTDVSAKVLAMYADTRTPSMEPQWLAAGLSQLYRFYHRTIYENFVESNEADLGAIESRHENDMEIIFNVVSQINLSADCTEFMLDKQPLKSTKLEEQLYRYTAVSQFFGQLLYFYHGD